MKLIVTDLDGTLIKENYLDEMFYNLRLLVAKNYDIIIATGRHEMSLTGFINNEELFTMTEGIICSNGAGIITNTCKIYKKMEPARLSKLIQVLNTRELYNDTKIFVDTCERKDYERTQFKNVLALKIFTKSERAYICVQYFIKMLGYDYDVFWNNGEYFIEIREKDVNKMTAIEELLRTNKKKYEQIYVVGNDYNDLCMLMDESKNYNKVVIGSILPQINETARYDEFVQFISSIK